jgi:hypothetical protein
MALPTLAERDIYDRAFKTHEARIAITMGPEMWTAEIDEQFATALDPAEFWFTQFGGDTPIVESNTLKFRQFGGPNREQVVTRKHWLPEDPTLSFQIDIFINFNTLDPVYPQVVTVGGIEQEFGVEHECMRVIQRGSGHVTAGIGNIFIDGAGQIETVAESRANDQSTHQYTVQWDPDAPGGAGSEKLTVRYDGAIVHESSAAGVAVQPRYISMGLIQSTREEAVPLGTPAAPFTTMLIDRIHIFQLGDGYETQTFPGWTTADLGNDIDTAADGERFQQDGVTWAKLPRDAVESFTIRSGRDITADTIALTLDALHPDDPVTTPNRFAGDRWRGRTLTVDTRILDDDGNATDWRRQICAILDAYRDDGDTVEITGRERPMTRLDTFISRSYLNIAPGSTSGEVEGTNIGFKLADILTDMMEVSDIVAGGRLGNVSTDILAPDVLPLSMSSGGHSLLSTFVEWCDRLVLEVWRRYRVSGAERYGQVRVNLWTFGTGSAIYTFAGRGATDDFENIVEVQYAETSGDRTGQAFYRQEAPNFGPPLQSLEFLPTIGQFPTAAYPPEARVLNDSLAYMETTGLSVLLGFPEADGTLATGGIARHRFRRENQQQRPVTIRCEGHDWVEPTDEIAVDDPDGTGITSSETWVVSNRTLRYESGRLSLEIEALTQDFVNAIIRGM